MGQVESLQTVQTVIISGHVMTVFLQARRSDHTALWKPRPWLAHCHAISSRFHPTRATPVLVAVRRSRGECSCEQTALLPGSFWSLHGVQAYGDCKAIVDTLDIDDFQCTQHNKPMSDMEGFPCPVGEHHRVAPRVKGPSEGRTW